MTSLGAASAPASGPALQRVAQAGAQTLAARGVLDAASRRDELAPWIAGGVSVLLHVICCALALLIGVTRTAVAPAAVSELVELSTSPAAPNPEPTLPLSAAAPVAAARLVPRARAKTAPQAGRVVSAAEQVVDFSDSIVTGSSSAYAAGQTPSAGSSTQAQRASASPGVAGSAPARDRSRAPQLAGGAHWDCPFPEQAAVDEAVVTLRVEVAADGRVLSAHATSESSAGFGREAQRCALDKRWSAGRDRAGQPVTALALVNVRFVR